MNLSKQEQKVYEFILPTPHSTTADIQHSIWVSCPSARKTEINKKALAEGLPEVIISDGKRYYDGAHPFEEYIINPAYLRAIEKPAPEPPLSEQAKQLALSMTA